MFPLSNQSTHPAHPSTQRERELRAANATGPLEELDTVEESNVDESALRKLETNRL